VRVLLNGLALETQDYVEDTGIRFTIFTYGDSCRTELDDVLASAGPEIDLRRGGERLTVRVCDHVITPPYSRRLGDSMHRHDVRLEAVL